MSNNVRIQIAIDSKTGEARVEALGDKFQHLGQKGKSSFDKVSNEADRLKKNISPLIGLATSLGAAFGAWKLSQLAGHMTDVASSFEQMEVKLDALTHGKGKETLEEINKVALDLPINTRQAVEAFTMMQAMGLDPTTEKLITLVDVASIFGEETLPRVARALGQMQTLGKLSAEELNQLSDAGINARKYLTEAFGMTVEELQKSQISIEQIIDAIWKGFDADYGGSAKKAMNSWKGMTATFTSYLEEIERKFMAAGIFDEMKTQLSGVNDELKIWVEQNEQIIKQKVPEYIARTKTALHDLYETYNMFPDVVVGAAGYGIVGTVIFGSRPAGVTLAAIYAANEAIDLFNESIDELLGFDTISWGKALRETMNNFKGIASGKLDWNTGAPITALESLQSRAAALRQEIIDLQSFSGPSDMAGDVVIFGGDKTRLADAKKELEQITREINVQQIQARAAAGEFDKMTDSWMRLYEKSEKAKTGKPGAHPAGGALPADLAKIVEQEQKKLEMALAGPTDLEQYLEKGGPDAYFLELEQKKTAAAVVEAVKRENILKGFDAEYTRTIKGQTEFELMQLEVQAENYLAAGADQIKVTEWKNAQIKQITQDTNSALVEFSRRTAEAMEQNFSDLFFDMMTGKFRDLNDFSNAVLTSLQRATADYLGQLAKVAMFGQSGTGGLVQMAGSAAGGLLGGLFGPVGGLVGGLFGGGSSVMSLPTALALVRHDGGSVGPGGPVRRVPAEIFHYAPRLHGGLKPGEFPAILEGGEEVKSKDQVRRDRAEATGRSGDTLNVNFFIQAIDTQTGGQFIVQNRGLIIGMVNQAYNQRGQRGPLG